MGQKEKARAIIEQDYEFVAQTKLDMEGVLAAARRAMEASSSKMKGRIEDLGLAQSASDSFTSNYVLKGPGGHISLMQIALEGKTAPDQIGQSVELTIGEFAYQKGSLGMKPSINGKNVIGKFVEVLKAELAAG